MTAAGVVEATRAERFLAGTVAAAVAPFVGANVYRAPAPDPLEDLTAGLLDDTMVVFSFVSAVDTVVPRTGPGTRALVRAVYLVKAIGPRDLVDLAPVADAVDLALHGAQGAVDGLTVTSTRESTVAYSEVASGRLYEHLGGLYRLELA